MQNSQTTSSLHTTCFWIASSIVLEPTINTLLHIQYIAQKLYVILFIWSIPCKTKSECNCEKWRLHNTPIRTVTHSCHLFTNTHTTLPSQSTHISKHTHPRSCLHEPHSRWDRGCKARLRCCPHQQGFGWVGQGQGLLRQSAGDTSSRHNGWSTSSHPYTPLG